MSSKEQLVIPGEIVGEMQEAISRLQFCAGTHYSILIIGQTGMVAERLARDVHEWSGRAGQFVAINCESLSDAVIQAKPEDERKGATLNLYQDFESTIMLAKDGTLFLDNADKMSMGFQGFLTVMLDAKKSGMKTHLWGMSHHEPVDVRIVAATSEDLKALTAEGRFFDKLYYHLDECDIDMRRVSGMLSEVLIPHYEAQVRKRGH